MKSIFITFLALLGCIFYSLGCAPKPQAKQVVAIPDSQFFLSGSLPPSLENLTLEEYALLNRNMDDLLSRIGLKDFKGYLIPLRSLDSIVPTIIIEGRAEPPLAYQGNDGLKLLMDRFSTECEKDISHEKEINKKPNKTTTDNLRGVAPSVSES